MSARLTDREYAEVLNRPDAQRAMALRCEEDGHNWENCMSATFQLYQACKWCGEVKNRRYETL